MDLNIIKARFCNNKKSAWTDEQWQWDYGQILQFVGLELPEAYEVHFSNIAIGGESITQIGNADGVTIPDQFFTSGETIYAWIYLHQGEDDGETVYSVTIPVKKRPQPSDIPPTPEEQSAIDQAIAALNAAVMHTAEDVETTTEKAEQATESANVAASAKNVIKEIAKNIPNIQGRVSSLTDTGLFSESVIEAAGIPVYVEDISDYAAYGITEAGWYVFARIATKEGTVVSASTTVTGAAGYIATIGEDHIDVAVKFEVAAVSQPVTITWALGNTETFVFKATDLAIRNLDYRVTFYVYDIDEFATWEYALTTDETFVADKYYYTKDENDVYTLAEVTVGEAVPADTYYVHSHVTFEGMARNITYRCNTVIDCPMTFILPEIEDDCHGCWFEIRFRHAGSYSSTLVPPEGVKVATEHTQAETAGMNMVNLHYTSVDGVKIWRFMNTHSTIPV